MAGTRACATLSDPSRGLLPPVPSRGPFPPVPSRGPFPSRSLPWSSPSRSLPWSFPSLPSLSLRRSFPSRHSETSTISSSARTLKSTTTLRCCGGWASTGARPKRSTPWSRPRCGRSCPSTSSSLPVPVLPPSARLACAQNPYGILTSVAGAWWRDVQTMHARCWPTSRRRCCPATRRP